MHSVPATLADLRAVLARGEGSSVEFKRSTGELKEGLETLCAFLNGEGGIVFFGIRPDGRAEGQQVSDKTLRDIAQAMNRFEPPVNVPVERLAVAPGREILILQAHRHADSGPFTFDGRPYERVSSTTRKMPLSTYERLLLDHAFSKVTWESFPAKDVRLEELDREEILRTRELAIQQNRISPGTSRDIEDILDGLGVRKNGALTHAAQVLYGTGFLSCYPQCLLKMGRFRGTKITGEIVDNRQEYLHAFAMVREGMAFLERTMPLGARFPEGSIFREDRFPVPLTALREILLNAVMHRDYSVFAGYVAIIVFDDRIEIQSSGGLPAGVTVKQLSGPHQSKRRNPFIAEAFHRTGAVEIWGRGTNRVIDECKQHGIPAPTFEERCGYTVVTFRARMADVTAQVTAQVTTQVAQLLHACRDPQSRDELQKKLGLEHRENFRKGYLAPAIAAGLIERTIPDKPNSRLQQYRLSAVGRAWLAAKKP